MAPLDFEISDEQEQIEAIWYKSEKLTEREDEIFFTTCTGLISFLLKRNLLSQIN